MVELIALLVAIVAAVVAAATLIVSIGYGAFYYYFNKKKRRLSYYNAVCNERHIEFDASGKPILVTRINYDEIEIKGTK